MFENINFLRERVRLQEATLQSDKRIALFTSVILGVFLAIVVGISGYRFFLASKHSALLEAQQTLEKKLLSMKETQRGYAVRQSLLKLAQTVIDKRTKAWDAITYLYSIIPQESTIEAIHLSSQDESLSFTVRAPDVFSYASLSAVLQSDQVNTSGYKPSLGSLSRREDGSYSLEVALFISAATKPTQSTQEQL